MSNTWEWYKVLFDEIINNRIHTGSVYMKLEGDVTKDRVSEMLVRFLKGDVRLEQQVWKPIIKSWEVVK